MKARGKRHLAVVPDKQQAAVCSDLLLRALDSAAIAELVIRGLNPEDFCEKERPIFEALRDTFPPRRAVDISAIGERVGWGLLADFQGRLPRVPVDGVFGALQEIRRGKLVGEAQRLIRAGDHGGAVALLSQIGQVGGDQRGIAGRVTDPLVNSFLAQMEENQKRGYLGPTTGLWPLDNLVLGMAPGTIHAIAGATSTGKSTYLAQVAMEAVQQNAVVAIFSLEMPIPWVLARLAGAYLRMSPTRIFMGNLKDEDRMLLQGTLEILKDSPLYIFRDATELSRITVAAREVKAAHGRLDIAIVDFIQNVGVREAGTQLDRMATAAVEFQRLAGETNACLLIASQLSNEAVREKGGGILSFRYAAELAHAADVALELVPKKEEGAVDLLVRKNRSGRLGQIPLRWTGEWSRLEVET